MATGILRIPTAMPIPHIAATAAREYNTKTHLISFNMKHLPNKNVFNTVLMCYNNTVNHLIKDNGVKT